MEAYHNTEVMPEPTDFTLDEADIVLAAASTQLGTITRSGRRPSGFDSTTE